LSIFKKPPPLSTITLTDNHSSYIKYASTDSYKDKFNALDINPQLSAKFLAGLLNVEGSGRYLTSRRNSKLIVESSLVYNIITFNEKINFQLQELEQFLALPMLNEGLGTHVVSEINWGSRNVVTVRKTVSHESDTGEAAVQLDAHLSKFKSLGFKFGGEFSKRDAQSSYDESVEVSVMCDVVNTDGLVPTDLASAEIFISNMKNDIATANGGKGKPLNYRLLSLSSLALRVRSI
jgi:hypothetical protein